MQCIHVVVALAAAMALGPSVVWSAEARTPAGLARIDLPASLPLRRDGASGRDDNSWTGPLVVLSLAGAGGAWMAWRRISRRRPRASGAIAGRSVVRVSSHALTPHASLHAVQWNGEELLLACTAQQVSVISRRAGDATAEAEEE